MFFSEIPKLAEEFWKRKVHKQTIEIQAHDLFLSVA